MSNQSQLLFPHNPINSCVFQLIAIICLINGIRLFSYTVKENKHSTQPTMKMTIGTTVVLMSTFSITCMHFRTFDFL